jgi:hypothetical protein
MAAFKPRTRFSVASEYRSGLEEDNAAHLAKHGVPVVFEQHSIEYTVPARIAKYTPDFHLHGNVFVETKGYFSPEDRKKHVHFKDSNPEVEIRFVFSRSSNKLSKTSKTTYASWCDKHGFKYADKLIPKEWFTN